MSPPSDSCTATGPYGLLITHGIPAASSAVRANCASVTWRYVLTVTSTSDMRAIFARTKLPPHEGVGVHQSAVARRYLRPGLQPVRGRRSPECDPTTQSGAVSPGNRKPADDSDRRGSQSPRWTAHRHSVHQRANHAVGSRQPISRIGPWLSKGNAGQPTIDGSQCHNGMGHDRMHRSATSFMERLSIPSVCCSKSV